MPNAMSLVYIPGPYLWPGFLGVSLGAIVECGRVFLDGRPGGVLNAETARRRCRRPCR
jgi:hypothetical protein